MCEISYNIREPNHEDWKLHFMDCDGLFLSFETKDKIKDLKSLLETLLILVT